MGTLHFATSEHENRISKMGAATAPSCLKARSCDVLQRQFSTVPENFRCLFVTLEEKLYTSWRLRS